MRLVVNAKHVIIEMKRKGNTCRRVKIPANCENWMSEDKTGWEWGVPLNQDNLKHWKFLLQFFLNNHDETWPSLAVISVSV